MNYQNLNYLDLENLTVFCIHYESSMQYTPESSAVGRLITVIDVT